MFRSNRIAAAAAALTLFALPASAITAVQTVEQKVTETLEDGSQRVTYIEADRVKPGEEVIYRLKYENDRDEAASNVALVMRVPEEVRYIEGSATEPGTRLAFSADGGNSFLPMGDLTVTEAGNIRTASINDITHIRWTFEYDIPANERGEINFRAILR